MYWFPNRPVMHPEEHDVDGFATTLYISHRNRCWMDRAGWIWRWDGKAKKWAGYCDGRYRQHVEENELNDWRDGRGYRPFIEVESI